jgi:hypothetical protein
MKYFNIAEPCCKEKHYMTDAFTCLQNAERLIDAELYFVIYAARQNDLLKFIFAY